MKKFEIPTADSMAELTKEKQKVYEQTVLEGTVFRALVSSIENAAIEGKSEISIAIQDIEHRKELKVIAKTLKAAGYTCEFENLKFPFLTPFFSISWERKTTVCRRPLSK